MVSFSRSANLKESAPRTILIRSTNWIGDAIMTTPAVHTIRENFPEAKITMLAVPWVADIFRLSPDVDEIIEYDKTGRYQGRIMGPIRLALDLRQHHFDAVILLQNAFEAAFIAALAGIPVRAGFRRDGRGLLLSHGVTIPDELRSRHQVHYYQYLLQGLGLTLGPDRLHLPLPERLSTWAKGYLDGLTTQVGGVSSPEGPAPSDQAGPIGRRIPVIGFNPGAAYGPAKRWPPDKFAALAGEIVDHYGSEGCLILVFGTKADSAAAAQIKHCNARTPSHVADLTAKTTLEQVIGLIACCDGFVTNDSGLMHVAAALHTPMVAIFGSTDHIATGPFSDNATILRKEMACSPCMQTECPQGHLNCLEQIGSREVFAALAERLNHAPSSAA